SASLRRTLGSGDHCLPAASSQSQLAPGYWVRSCQWPCSRATTRQPLLTRCRAATPPPAPAPMISTSAGVSAVIIFYLTAAGKGSLNQQPGHRRRPLGLPAAGGLAPPGQITARHW